MRFEQRAMVAPVAVAAGAAVLFERFIEKTVLVGGTFSATMRVQGSIDGSTWADVSADITAPSAVEIPHSVRYLRINTTLYVSGTPVVSVGGFDARAI